MDTLKQLRIKNIERGRLWEGVEGEELTNENLLFRSNEMAGEVGEACDAVKKLIRYRKRMVGGTNYLESLKAISDELADVIITADRVASILGIDLGVAVCNKFNYTSDKHGFKIKIEKE